MRTNLFLCFGLIALRCYGQAYGQSQDAATLERFKPHKSPAPSGLVLRPDDRLAICGDSITEQKMYSRIMEDYLTMCVPELHITVRQFGWSGERAPGFLARMTNDCLRFKPTVATTCYGMNDHEYRAYEERIGKAYRANSTAIIEAFKANGVRVIQGSPGCVGKMPGWVRSASGTVLDLNLNLCTLRDIGIEIAEKEKVGFADVFWPMMTAGAMAHDLYGTNYAIAGADGVHPGWAGQTVMAYAFLKAMGLDGDIGTFTVDLKKDTLKTSPGHDQISGGSGEFRLRSRRYPFCACAASNQVAAAYPVCEKDNLTGDQSIRSAFTLIPFEQDLNRLTLIVKNGKAPTYKVTWGTENKTFATERLESGVNLAQEFPQNPFTAAFAKVDAAVAAKQAFETKQIKQTFRSPEAKTNLAAVARSTEIDHAQLALAISKAFVPIVHVIKIEAD